MNKISLTNVKPVVRVTKGVIGFRILHMTSHDGIVFISNDI
jgi:hypothetical protein